MTPDTERLRAWLTLHLLPDLGPVRIARLVEQFGSPEAALGASRAEWEATPGLGALAAEALVARRRLVDLDAELEAMETHGVRAICLDDAAYPENLRSAPAPPPVLMCRGALEPVDQAAVAVIGARKMSRYGREATHAIVGELARAGVTIVSGLAMGIDAEAHRAALEAGGRTLAVLGNGLAHVHPAQNRRLAEEVVERGALLSTMRMAARPDAGSFPERNAVIAGLALGVVVVEAGAKSGTSITAGDALDAGRTVFAVPGDVTRVNSVGTNRLIQQGAKLTTCGRDVLIELRGELQHLLDGLPGIETPEHTEPAPPPKDLNETERALCDLLETDPLHLDVLCDAMAERDVSAGAVAGALLQLELRGVVRQDPGKRFVRVR